MSAMRFRPYILSCMLLLAGAVLRAPAQDGVPSQTQATERSRRDRAEEELFKPWLPEGAFNSGSASMADGKTSIHSRTYLINDHDGPSTFNQTVVYYARMMGWDEKMQQSVVKNLSANTNGNAASKAGLITYHSGPGLATIQFLKPAPLSSVVVMLTRVKESKITDIDIAILSR